MPKRGRNVAGQVCTDCSNFVLADIIRRKGSYPIIPEVPEVLDTDAGNSAVPHIRKKITLDVVASDRTLE